MGLTLRMAVMKECLSFLAMNLGGKLMPSALASLIAFENLRLKALVE